MKSFKTLLALFVIVHHVNSNVVVKVEQNVNFGSKNDGSEDNGSEDFGTNELSDGQYCVWDKDEDFPKNAPILLNSAFQMVLPEMKGDKRIVRVKAGTELTIACAGENIQSLRLKTVNGTCVGDKLININGTNWTMDQLGCVYKAKSSILKTKDRCGANETGVYAIIGFDIATTGNFYELIKVCFDHKAETTIYTQHTIHGANIAARDPNRGRRPEFKPSDGFFNVKMKEVYYVKSQLERMEKLLNDMTLAHEMINERFNFTKGHMAPRGDFVTKVEQDATFYFINAVPQWNTFNSGNWEQLESSTRNLANATRNLAKATRNLAKATRNLAKIHGTNLTVYTGTFEVLKLKGKKETPTEIYLGLYEDRGVVPAPALIWKVVYEESSERAVAVVGINNPHITEAPPVLCDDICERITWLNRTQFDNLTRGYTYCCTVEDLSEAIPNIPYLGNVTLLDS